MEIQEIKIEQIKPYKNNAKKHSETQIANVAESIKQFGWAQPIVLDSNKEIIIGHCRYLAAQRLGMQEVPCLIVDLSAEKVKKLRNLDNKLNESEWDFDLLKDDILGLDFDGFDIDWGIEEEHITDIVEDDTPEVDEQNEPITQLGDIWQLGEHRLMCGDSTDAGAVAILMDGRKADLLLTDPPYNVAYEGKTKDALTIQNDKMESSQFKDFLANAFRNAKSVLLEGGGYYIWFASREHCNFENALNEAGLQVRQELIWKKNTMVLGRQDYQWKHEPCLYGWNDGASHNWYSDRKQTTILEFDKPSRSEDHPTMKPVELFAYQIQNSTKKGNVVLDLFGGSGTTIIACEQTGRIGYCMELDPKYCDVIIKRYENLTGNKAVKINIKSEDDHND
nr:MAG TPA: adenine specific DNA methyltransferase [Caudoviricetes sp.]